MPDPQGQPITDTSTISAPKDNAATGLSHPLTAESLSPSELLQVPGHVADAISHMSDSIENYTQEGRELHPVLAKLGDATREAKALLTGGQSAGKPMGTSSGVLNNPVTTAMSGADVAPEAGAAVESGLKKAADYLTDRRAFAPNPETGHIVFDNLSSHLTHPEMDMAQGGHAGGGVASVEELNRPGRFVKVSRSGQLTDQGKVPDFNLKPGEAGYQVTPQGYELKAGQETPATKLGVDKYHKEVFKPSVKTTQGPPVENAGIIQNARKILRDPAATEEDKAIATRQLEHQHETRFESNEPAKSEITYRTDNNGTRWAKTPDSPAEVSVPKDMKDADVEKYAKEKLDLQKNFAKSRSETKPTSSEPPKRYRIVNTKTGESFGNYGDKARASRAMDTRDNIYGGYIHKVEEIPRGTSGNFIKPTDSDSPMAKKALAKD